MAARRLLELKRMAEVIGILFEHDFFGLMKRLARAPRLPLAPGKDRVVIPEDVPRRVRLLMEDLGPTFVKMGQVLATRPDLIPEPFVEEFRNFYDRTRPTPFPEVRALVEAELGKPLEAVFASFEPEPIASASIAQVHEATLRSGERVAVKVQHPGIEAQVAIDFEILRPLVRFFQNLFAASRLYQPSAHLHEIEEMLKRELDFTHEGRILQRFHRNFEGWGDVKVPRPLAQLSTRRILVMEFVEGLPLSQATPARLEAMGVDRRALARVLTRAMAKMVFEDRLFHADPSPGNIILTGPRSVAFIDFGAVGHVSRRRAERVMRLIHGFTREDLEEVTEALLEVCNILGPVDPAQLKRDVEKIIDHAATERAAVGDPVVMDLIAKTALNNHMLLPPDFFLINRALFQFEGICSRLDPDYDIVREFTPLIVGYLSREAFGASGAQAVRDVALAYAELARDLPGRLNNLLRKLETNQLEVRVHPVGGDGVQREERRSLRLSVTALVGALVVGAGLTFSSASAEALGNFLFVAVLLSLAWASVMLYYSE